MIHTSFSFQSSLQLCGLHMDQVPRLAQSSFSSNELSTSILSAPITKWAALDGSADQPPKYIENKWALSITEVLILTLTLGTMGWFSPSWPIWDQTAELTQSTTKLTQQVTKGYFQPFPYIYIYFTSWTFGENLMLLKLIHSGRNGVDGTFSSWLWIHKFRFDLQFLPSEWWIISRYILIYNLDLALSICIRWLLGWTK